MSEKETKVVNVTVEKHSGDEAKATVQRNDQKGSGSGRNLEEAVGKAEEEASKATRSR